MIHHSPPHNMPHYHKTHHTLSKESIKVNSWIWNLIYFLDTSQTAIIPPLHTPHKGPGMSIAWNSVLFTSTSIIFMQLAINFYSSAIYIATMIIQIVRYLLNQHYAD